MGNVLSNVIMLFATLFTTAAIVTVPFQALKNDEIIQLVETGKQIIESDEAFTFMEQDLSETGLVDKESIKTDFNNFYDTYQEYIKE